MGSPGFVSTRSSAHAQLVGRSVELTQLREAYRDAAAGTPRVVLVEGEPGIGKTALVNCLLEGLSDAHVITAQALETEADIEFALLDQLLRTAGLLRDVLGSQTSQVDAGLHLLDDFGALQAAQPLVVVVDDAQWSNAASLRTLLFALRRLTTDRVLTLFVVREDDAWALPDSVRKLAAARGATVRLGPLEAPDLAELARVYDVALPARGLRHLLEVSRGNPLYAHAFLDETPPDAWLDADHPLPPPRSLAHLVQQRTASLSEAAQGLLDAVAVLDRTAPSRPPPRSPTSRIRPRRLTRRSRPACCGSRSAPAYRSSCSHTRCISAPPTTASGWPTLAAAFARCGACR